MNINFDASLIKKYDTFGPRYTSYPTALSFNPSFKELDYRDELALSNQTNKPISLYFHIPFCKSLCYYCACAKIITHKNERTIPYLEHLTSEIKQQAKLVGSKRTVTQLHLGGGTPTYLSDDQLASLMQSVYDNFNVADANTREFSIEVDPRAVRPTTIPLLHELGFNRISLGVQDFDPKVQQAVNRIQTIEQTFDVLDAAREMGYRSSNIDLIYGLPFQSVDSFAKTLDIVLGKRPERLAIYNYAHMPNKVKAQQLIITADLPSAKTKLAILEMTIKKLQAAGYVYLGMDHFALPTDELAIAKKEGSLQRNFQGYSTHADSDLIGMGMTSISKIGNCFAQNSREEKSYFELIKSGHLATNKGYRLTIDDQIRRDVIQSLMCQTEVNYQDINQIHQINFADYFQSEIAALAEMANDGLLSIDPDKIIVNPTGQLLLRNIAMIFDAYLKPSESIIQFSKVI
ncbi:oxygen-independent coproporphyrinogen III oxidase [Reinekea sp.]|jgi:oxygen-independent coproporphyrinogen-3 oxidase|uniref:oxygen-independent coproporphyrinogen III oxidase n=2 Tax=Reinekea sp. TaxID=1970455 RepID=UPI003989D39B